MRWASAASNTTVGRLSELFPEAAEHLWLARDVIYEKHGNVATQVPTAKMKIAISFARS
jgi:hypothetical protein